MDNFGSVFDPTITKLCTACHEITFTGKNRNIEFSWRWNWQTDETTIKRIVWFWDEYHIKYHTEETETIFPNPAAALEFLESEKLKIA